jgi:MYXO-CTERM domain-containing protein
MKNNLLKFYILTFYICSTFIAFAQPGTNNDTSDLEGGDAAPAPINDYIWVLALIGLVLVFLRLRAIHNNTVK